MKRTFAVVVLLAALGVLSKLTLKSSAPGPGSSSVPAVGARAVSDQDRATVEEALDARSELARRYAGRPQAECDLAARVGERFRQTALAIDRTDGVRGLRLLDRLDLEAVYLYEKHPREFRSLRELLDDDSAAEVLLHWREYFGLKRADDTDRSLLISELAHLSSHQRRIAARYPAALPLLLADPDGVMELVDAFSGDERELGDALLLLSLMSLEHGASDIRVALRTLENHRVLALEAFRQQGLEGFAIVTLYGPVLELLGSSMPLEQSLILLRVNSEFVDEQLRTHRPETVASHLSHVAARGLVKQVGASPAALRLLVEYADRGEAALAKAGPDAAEVVYGDFSDPTLRNQAVAALGEHGAMALVILDKYATDPDFREILRAHGGVVIPPIAQVDASPEALALIQAKERRTLSESLAKLALLASGDNGQAVIRTIKKDGLQRVSQLYASQVEFQQFLPMYDLLHLGNVIGRGHSPTAGEMTWALVDGCFVVADVLSLAAVQPEAAVAAEVVHTEVKAAARAGIRSAGREGAATGRRALAGGTEAATRQLARWWTVRSAGGLYEVLRRLPEALPKMNLTQVVTMARPLCARAGMRLSTWRPIHLLRDGVALPFQIPPERGLKYVGAQLLQASVGVVGFQKMEEHLASRRPGRPIQ